MGETSTLLETGRRDGSRSDLQLSANCHTIPRADGLSWRNAALRAGGAGRLRISAEERDGSSGLCHPERAWIARAGGVPVTGVRFFDLEILFFGPQVTFHDQQVTFSDLQVTVLDLQVAVLDLQVTVLDLQVTVLDLQVAMLDLQVALLDLQVAVLDLQVAVLDLQVAMLDLQVTMLDPQVAFPDPRIIFSDLGGMVSDPRVLFIAGVTPSPICGTEAIRRAPGNGEVRAGSHSRDGGSPARRVTTVVLARDISAARVLGVGPYVEDAGAGPDSIWDGASLS